MDQRMANAMDLSQKLWAKAWNVAPEFCEEYLELCFQLLNTKDEVPGDIFRRYCGDRGLVRPEELDRNVWVSGVHHLYSLGWITKVGVAEPTEGHNHMPVVTIWRSEIFNGNPGVTPRGKVKKPKEAT